MFIKKDVPDHVEDSVVPSDDFYQDPSDHAVILDQFKAFLSQSRIDKSPRELERIRMDQIMDLKRSYGIFGSMFETEEDAGLARYLPFINTFILVVIMMMLFVKK